VSDQYDIAIAIPPESQVGDPVKPDLPENLFWEYDYETIDWHGNSAVIVIERVLDRGNSREFEELIRFYGREKVLQVLKHETIYLMDHSIERACAYFKLTPEELVCYMRKRSRPGHWL
jgi:hypothetical protein